jgi:hypothetical protein
VNEELYNLTIGELLKTNKGQIKDNKLIDLDAKVAVNLEHYDQWARTRRPEPNLSSTKPYAAQMKDNRIKKESVEPGAQQKREHPRPKSVHGIYVCDTKLEMNPEIFRGAVGNDILKETEEFKEDSSDTAKEGERLSRLMEWHSWSGKQPKITRNVLKELHASCAEIIKHVKRGSYGSYCTQNSQKDSNKRTTSPEKICDNGSVPLTGIYIDAMENTHDISLRIRKLPATLRSEESVVKNYRHTLYQIPDQHNMVTPNMEVKKNCTDVRESTRNYAQYKMQVPVAKREPILLDNRNLALDFRSKRIENLWKLCGKPAKDRSNSKIASKHKHLIRRRFHNEQSFPLTLGSFLNKDTEEAGRHGDMVNWNELLTLQNSSSFRFSINNHDNSEKTLVKGESKVLNVCI